MQVANRIGVPPVWRFPIVRFGPIAAWLVLSLFAFTSWGGAESPSGWKPLFDGKTLSGWKITDFGGQGAVRVDQGRILLATGDDLTGITVDQPIPMMNYEIELEAMRVDGHDFFCGLTFPVAKEPCSLILGGWGGSVVGLSSIDGLDASENETSTARDFANGRWYRIRLRVSPSRIAAWIDDEKVVDLATEGRRISIRSEVDASRPLGIASWRTAAALRGIRLRRL